MNPKSVPYVLSTLVLRIVVLAALLLAVRSIYLRLPPGDVEIAGDSAAETSLQIVLRPSLKDDGANIGIPVQIYPVDLGAAQREFAFEPHPGIRFEDFLKDRMQGRAPVKAQLNENGQVVVRVKPGKWWIYASLAGIQNVEWRLPVNVSGEQQTVELTGENIYARTKSF